MVLAKKKEDKDFFMFVGCFHILFSISSKTLLCTVDYSKCWVYSSIVHLIEAIRKFLLSFCAYLSINVANFKERLA